jgi:outer membrane protein OmpA-like peptidoglycan-associated protein
MKAIYLFLCSIFLIEASTIAQNLINNPKFDDYSTYLDSKDNLIYQPDYWYYNIKNLNHPIYYSSARFLNKSLNNNSHPDADLIQKGQQVNYIGIVILPKPQKAYTALKEPLKKGQKYHLKVDIKANALSNCISDLLVGFKDCLDCNIDSALYQLRLVIPDSVSIDSLVHNWLTLNSDFTASGNEKVFVISAGSAKDYINIIDSNPEKFQIDLNHSYYWLKYFIDNISLTENKNDSSFAVRIDSLNIGQSLILQNIYFDFDKYVLLKESFLMLDSIADYLDKKRNIRIQVTGHTDNVGSNEYNNELSNKRAMSVVDYLVNKGIAASRLQAAGFGSGFPIESNDTEEGRQKNRRIEIKIIDK